MEELKVNKEDIIKAYKEGNNETKACLTKIFGKETFMPKFDDSIKTWKDVCAKLKISENQDVFRRLYQDIHCEQLHEKAFCKAEALYMLIAIQTAINDGIDFDDNGRSYYPYWLFYSEDEMDKFEDCKKPHIKRVVSCDGEKDIDGYGVYFADAYSRRPGHGTDYGLPISYNSKEAAEHAAKYFEDIFFEYYGIHAEKMTDGGLYNAASQL